ncbi:hypothetical protein LOTGIDRAFT_231539 [Lottia gigantea]|uniref:Uncharacterized protein n=1 Tax=Lottia gigantea TaxID=225164 RepID=V4A0N7_LOTGI|nr:hypothetical protein LOTGIDRAFT_231539 [Lottia gigantea]ESO97343.1 hypothetical protein LOTGIDRAFT_231539 [Lottia gigantea]
MMFPGNSRFNSSYFPSQSGLVPPGSNMGLNNNLYLQSNSPFTFGSPTQSPIITSSQQQYNTARGINVNRMIAPGLGVSWQHTVPKQMPWSEPSTVIQFTSPHTTSVSQPVPRSSPGEPITKPIHLRTKRHHLSSTNDGCPPRKQFISADKMAARLQNLCIGSVDNQQNTVGDGWDKFLDLEERLKDEEIEESSPELNSSTIRINEDFKDSILKRDSILPAKVLNRLHKPSLEVVLWKPPEGVVSEIINKVKKEETDKGNKSLETDSDLDMTSMQDESSINQPLLTGQDITSNGNDMEVDSIFDLDDDMSL